MLPEPLAQLASNFLQSYAAALMLNGAALTGAYLLFWRAWRQRLRHWKIQLRTRVDRAQLRREWKNALLTLGVGAGMSCAVLYLSSLGYTKIYRDPGAHPVATALGGFVALLLLDDAWFYWMHRLLHHPVWYRYVHAEHHKSLDVNPYSSLSFHFVEPFLLSAWIFPVAFIFPIYAPTLLLVQLWGLLDNIKSHLGYELYPAGFNSGWLRFLTSSTHHNMHHQRFRGNYGVHFRLWDRLLGTEFPDYETEFERIQKRKKTGAAKSGFSDIAAP